MEDKGGGSGREPLDGPPMTAVAEERVAEATPGPRRATSVGVISEIVIVLRV